MTRSLLVLAGALLFCATGCSTGQPQRSEENFVAATASIPGTARAKLVVGGLACEEMQAGASTADTAAALSGEIFTPAEAADLVSAAKEHLCP